jgi:hypothetical protein
MTDKRHTEQGWDYQHQYWLHGDFPECRQHSEFSTGIYIAQPDCWLPSELSFDHGTFQMFNWISGNEQITQRISGSVFSRIWIKNRAYYGYVTKGWFPWATQRKLN